MFSGSDDATVMDRIAFITSKDVSAIASGATRPGEAFKSPFLGESIEEVSDWFVNNIAPSVNAFTEYSFLVMDSRTAEDNTCLLVCTLDDELKTLRCGFDVAQLQISSIEYGDAGMEDGIRDLFMEAGAVMTREKYDLAVEGGLPTQPIYFPPNFVKHDGPWTMGYATHKEISKHFS